jgi:hypothetical protein
MLRVLCDLKLKKSIFGNYTGFGMSCWLCIAFNCSDYNVEISSAEMSIHTVHVCTYLCIYVRMYLSMDRLCGLVVRFPGCRATISGFDSPRYHIFWVAVDLERSPLRLVGIIEELLEREVAALVWKQRLTAVGNRRADHATPIYPQKLALKFVDQR